MHARRARSFLRFLFEFRHYIPASARSCYVGNKTLAATTQSLQLARVPICNAKRPTKIQRAASHDRGRVISYLRRHAHACGCRTRAIERRMHGSVQDDASYTLPRCHVLIGISFFPKSRLLCGRNLWSSSLLLLRSELPGEC